MRAYVFSLIRGWRAALLVVAAACATPDQASAGCGDYVTILNGSSDAHHAAPAEPRQPMKTPCHGPNCSGEPVRQQAPPAPAAPVVPQGKEVAGAVDSAVNDADPRSLREIDSLSSRPIRRPSSVFHPPRLG